MDEGVVIHIRPLPFSSSVSLNLKQKKKRMQGAGQKKESLGALFFCRCTLHGNGRYIICKKENVNKGAGRVGSVRYEYEKAFLALRVLLCQQIMMRIWTVHKKKIKTIKKKRIFLEGFRKKK